MQNVKFIGITQRLVENASYVERRECLSVEWGRFFRSEPLCSYMPLPLSYEIPFESYMPLLSAIILSGGNDLYSCNANPLSYQRDDYEKRIIENAIKTKIPLLGVCRGAQLIAEYFGSELQSCCGHIGVHSVDLVNDFWGGLKKAEVNSFHQFCITQLGKELRPLAFGADKTIEAFKHHNLPIFAILWHIEREEVLCEVSCKILQQSFLTKEY
ncbi:hypothetical protein CCZ01_04460 [Helicobacter monodelphidis]|uniref:gamma-glutamyl-CDP-amidate hydrolase n=1 Tax=Helicobacter sp. 15-1451 TaxID=2004995 RepID=UPI000DCCACE3|nr:gamma-glutamyl-CDP-amidate hydrolase [Helicobacter sp. 15-1451]RAX57886.1 hypothetical protein CCZ01_04460 [Helicobacter sp. 15-1451]